MKREMSLPYCDTCVTCTGHVVCVQVLYHVTLLYAVITSFMFTHVVVFYSPFINTATMDQRENNRLSDAQVPADK